MRKTFFLLALALVTCFGNSSYAQVSVSFNLGVQPAWGPTGYDNVQYYYIPDADAYYDVNRRVFVYQQEGRWIDAPGLPGQYANMDLYHVHKVVVNQPSPWLHDRTYRRQYSSFRGRHDQEAIRDSHDEKYFQNPGHPQHEQWARQHVNGYNNGHDNGRHDNRYHDNGHDNGYHDNGNRDNGNRDNGGHDNGNRGYDRH